MPWGKLDDKFHRNKKVRRLRRMGTKGREALGIWVFWWSWCLDDPKLDGVVPEEELDQAEQKLAELLCSDLHDGRGLWVRVDGGFRFHDFDEYNPTREQVDAKREADRIRVATKRGAARANVARDSSSSRELQPSESQECPPRVASTRDPLPLPLPDPALPDPLPSGPETTRSDSSGGAEPGPLSADLAAALSVWGQPATDRDHALAAAETMIRKEFSNRFHAAAGSLWTRAGDPALATLAAWALSVHGGPENAVKRLLDNFFADPWVQSEKCCFDVRHLARHPQKYFNPRKAPSAAATVDREAEIVKLRLLRDQLALPLNHARGRDDKAAVAKVEARISELNAQIRALKEGE